MEFCDTVKRDDFVAALIKFNVTNCLYAECPCSNDFQYWQLRWPGWPRRSSPPSAETAKLAWLPGRALAEMK